MAEIVGGIALSHSVMLPAEPSLWLERAGHDRHNPELYDSAGVLRTFDELVTAAGGRYEGELAPGVWERRYRECQDALDRLADHVRSVAPDVLVVVGDDQHEVFDAANQPSLGICWAEQWTTSVIENPPPGRFFEAIASSYAMDEHHRFAGSPKLALDLVTHTVQQGFDVASMADTPPGRGFGHAYGFVIRRLLDDTAVPVVPVLVNTYYPPNQPPPARCYDFGSALASAIRASDEDLRVMMVASGGLTHFVIDEALDRRVLAAIEAHDGAALGAIPAALLRSGSSEIRNWITVAAAMGDAPVAWSTYVPCYRTAAGTGCAMGFLQWG